MPRQRRNYLSDTASMVNSWASWCLLNLPCNSISYPSSTAEARAGQGQGSNKPGSIQPNLMMPKPVQRVDRAIQGIPPDLYQHIEDKYFAGKQVSRFKEDQALIWISARIFI